MYDGLETTECDWMNIFDDEQSFFPFSGKGSSSEEVEMEGAIDSTEQIAQNSSAPSTQQPTTQTTSQTSQPSVQTNQPSVQTNQPSVQPSNPPSTAGEGKLKTETENGAKPKRKRVPKTPKEPKPKTERKTKAQQEEKVEGQETVKTEGGKKKRKTKEENGAPTTKKRNRKTQDSAKSNASNTTQEKTQQNAVFQVPTTGGQQQGPSQHFLGQTHSLFTSNHMVDNSQKGLYQQQQQMFQAYPYPFSSNYSSDPTVSEIKSTQLAGNNATPTVPARRNSYIQNSPLSLSLPELSNPPLQQSAPQTQMATYQRLHPTTSSESIYSAQQTRGVFQRNNSSPNLPAYDDLGGKQVVYSANSPLPSTPPTTPGASMTNLFSNSSSMLGMNTISQNSNGNIWQGQGSTVQSLPQFHESATPSSPRTVNAPQPANFLSNSNNNSLALLFGNDDANRKIGRQNKVGMHPFADFVGFLVAPMRIQHIDSYVNFTIDTKLASLMAQICRSERFRKLSEVEQPIQVQLGCFLSGKPSPSRNNKYVLISVNGKMIPAKLQYTCININRYLQRGTNIVRISCPSGVPHEPYFICQIQLMRCYPASELLDKIRLSPKPSIDQIKASIKRSFSTNSEIQQISSMVSLKCPITRQRISVAGRSIHCNHIQCFDIYNFFSYSLKSLRTKWLCPICNKPITFDTLFEDLFFEAILNEVKDPEASEIEIFSDSTWRVVQVKTTSDDEISDLTSANQTDSSKAYYANWPNSFSQLANDSLLTNAPTSQLDAEFVDKFFNWNELDSTAKLSDSKGQTSSFSKEFDEWAQSLLDFDESKRTTATNSSSNTEGGSQSLSQTTFTTFSRSPTNFQATLSRSPQQQTSPPSSGQQLNSKLSGDENKAFNNSSLTNQFPRPQMIPPSARSNTPSFSQSSATSSEQQNQISPPQIQIPKLPSRHMPPNGNME